MKKAKKLVGVIVCLAGIVSASLGLTACHEHSWDSWKVSETPTQTQSGKATRDCTNEGCKAGAGEKEYILPALTSEDYVKSEDSATCSSTGKISYTYNKDGVSLNFDVATQINADAHKYGDYVKTDAAGHYKVCEHNGEHKTTAEVHDTNGVDGACSVCGYKAAPVTHNHTYSEWVKTDPAGHYKTCTGENCTDAAGTKYYGAVHDTDGEDGACSVCGYKAEIPVTHNHTYSEWVKTDPAGHYKTCTGENCTDAAGTKYYGAVHDTNGTDGACSVCGYKAEMPETHNHTYSEWVKTDPAGHYKTCTGENCTDAAGTKYYESVHDTNGEDGACSACGYKAVPAHKHSWGAWTVTAQNQPTATPGKATRTCLNDGCDATAADKEYELPALTSSDYTKTDDTATIDAEGTITYTYNKNGVNVSFNVTTPRIESRIYTITVKNSKDEPLRSVTVKLGDYTAKTDEHGVAAVKAEKKDYTVVIEDAPYAAADRMLYDALVNVSDEHPAATVWFAEAAPSSGGSSETSPKVITEDGIYYVTLSSREDPEIAGYYQIREFYIAAKAEVGAASINVEIINDNTVIGVMDAGYDQIENKGASYDIVKERGERTVFAVTSSDTEITAGYTFTVFFKIKKSLPPEAGCKERPIRATEGDNGKTVANSGEKVYFRLDYNTFGNYVLATFGNGVNLYDSELKVSDEGTLLQNGCTLTIPEYGYRYVYATSTSGECKINLERTVLEGMKGRPFTAKTDGSDNTVNLDLSAGVLEQWYKIEVPESGNYVLKTNDMRSYLTAYSDIGGTEFIVKSGIGTSLPLALTANTPVYVKAESHMNLTYTFTCTPATDEDMGTNPQQPMTLVSGEYNVNSTSDAEGKNSYYVFTAEENTKLTVSYPGGGTFMLTVFNNAGFDGANGGQIDFVSTWTNNFTMYLLKGETYYFVTNARNAGGKTFTFSPVVLENRDYEITFTMPDETPVSSAMTVKLMKGEEEVASGTLSEGKVTFENIKPDSFKLVVEGMPEGYGCYAYQLAIPLNDDEKTEKTIQLTQFVDFSVTVKLPDAADSAPVEGAQVILYNDYLGELTAVSTNAEGKATISALPPVTERGQKDCYYIKVALPDDIGADYYYASNYEVVKVASPDLEIALTQKYELVIKVVLSDGTTPAVGQKVVVSNNVTTYEVTTDNDGVVRVKIAATSAQSWTAEVELGDDLAGQYYSGTINLSQYQNGVEKTLTLKEYKNYTLTLKVDGVAVGEGVEVTLTKSGETWTQTTGADGTVQFNKLEPGTYTITLSGNYMTFDKLSSKSEETLDLTCYLIENMDKLLNGLTLENAQLTETTVTEGKTPVYTAVTSRTTKAFYKFATAGTYTITVSDINSSGICVDRVFMNEDTTNLFTTTNSTVAVNEEDKLSSGYTKFTVTLNEGEFIVFKLLNSSKETSSVYSYIEVTKVEE